MRDVHIHEPPSQHLCILHQLDVLTKITRARAHTHYKKYAHTHIHTCRCTVASIQSSQCTFSSHCPSTSMQDLRKDGRTYLVDVRQHQFRVHFQAIIPQNICSDPHQPLTLHCPARLLIQLSQILVRVMKFCACTHAVSAKLQGGHFQIFADDTISNLHQSFLFSQVIHFWPKASHGQSSFLY